MDVDKGTKKLTMKEAVVLMQADWEKVKTTKLLAHEAGTFLEKFYAEISAKLGSEVSLDNLRSNFLFSASQASLRQDILTNRVLFRAKAGAEFGPLRKGNSFDEICSSLLDFLLKKRKWKVYSNLMGMFERVKKLSKTMGCNGIGLLDLLARLLKRNSIELKPIKVRKERKLVTKAVADRFISYLNALEDSKKPTNRAALQVAYEDFLEVIEDKPLLHKNVTFKRVIIYLKQKKFLEFSPGAGNITFLKSKNLPTGRNLAQRKRQSSARSSRNNQDEQVNADNKHEKTVPESQKYDGKFCSRLAANAHGISITSALDSEMTTGNVKIDLGSCMKGQKASTSIVIAFTGESKEQNIQFKGCKFLDNADNVFSYADSSGICQGGKNVNLSSGSSYEIKLNYESRNIEVHSSPMVFQFEAVEEKRELDVVRFVHAETKIQEIDDLQPIQPYRRQNFRKFKNRHRDILLGDPPIGMTGGPVKVPLADYCIPKDFRKQVDAFGNVSETLKVAFDHPMAGNEHLPCKFYALLFIEELQMEIDIRRFDMENVELERKNNLISLKVPGLAEGKPSLIVGDKVYVSILPETASMVEYQGYIHVVERDEIQLKFHKSFHSKFIVGQKHKVRFTFNRGPMRLQHRALDMGCSYVEHSSLCRSTTGSDYERQLLSDHNEIRCFNRNIENNAEQLKAVKNIVAGSSWPSPYIIFGPPGTGKTATCVEAMKQILKMLPKSRILACAPSNSAADLILHRLANQCPILKKYLMRINAFSRSVHSLPKDLNINSFCRIKNNAFEMPPLSEIQECRVIVCTMTTAGRLVTDGLPKSHFTHIFLDECGQAVEPEALIPLSGLIDDENPDGGRIILAGDPMQLGPVVQSPTACENGLQVSLLERLMMQYKIYQKSGDDEAFSDTASTAESFDLNTGTESDDKEASEPTTRVNGLNENLDGDIDDGDDDDDDDDDEDDEAGSYNEKFITKLLKNYRSHTEIIKQPNELFYANELIPAADELKVTNLCQWSMLPTKGFPIIFHGIQGQDTREASSPSFFNPQEVVAVVEYVALLLNERSLGVTPDDIGIISPYRKQVSKIRQLLRQKVAGSIEEIKVGSVEEFQGQERRVIIISTVRSNKEYMKVDSKFRLGFLKNPKRFNVAVTRAQALLIVVGNPFVLSEDHHWNALLKYCQIKGGYKGCRFDYDVVDDLADMFSDVLGAAFNAFKLLSW